MPNTVSYKPLMIVIILISVIGIILPLCLSQFTPATVDQSSILAPLYNIINNGFEIPVISIHFNPLALLPFGLGDFVKTQMIAFSYIPSIIAVPLILIIIILYFYAIWGLIVSVIP